VEEGHWWFRSRNRLILWALESKVGSFRSFLEVGCGTGFVLQGVQQRFPDAELQGAEYFEEGLVHARRRVPTATFRRLDATTMTDANAYDVIGAFDVIEHIEADETVLKNFANALKPNGTLVISVPQHRWLWSSVDEAACHVRRYSRAELVSKIERAGLRVNYTCSFVSLLVPLILPARFRSWNANSGPFDELRLAAWLNQCLEWVMKVEFTLIKWGVRFPVGGSLLVVAKK